MKGKGARGEEHVDEKGGENRGIPTGGGRR